VARNKKKKNPQKHQKRDFLNNTLVIF